MRKSLTALILGLSLSSTSIPWYRRGTRSEPGVVAEEQIKEVLSKLLMNIALNV